MTKQEMIEEATTKFVDLVNRLGGEANATIADHGSWREFRIEGEIGRESSVWKMIMDALSN